MCKSFPRLPLLTHANQVTWIKKKTASVVSFFFGLLSTRFIIILSKDVCAFSASD